MRRVIFGLCVYFCIFVLVGVSFAGSGKSQGQHYVPQIGEKVHQQSFNNIVYVVVNGLDAGKQGRFNIFHADLRPLTYWEGMDGLWTSHFNVKVDSYIGSNDPTMVPTNLPFSLVSSPQTLPDSTITTTWTTEFVHIEQRLKPVEFSPTTGAILIKYIVTNTDSYDHQVGLLLELDTMIDYVDDAKISTSYGYSGLSQRWDSPYIPAFWQAYEDDPPNMGLIAQGTLTGGEATPPDVVIVADWGTQDDLVLAAVAWEFFPEGAEFGDSAVILRWNETTLRPGEQRTFATYYGIGAPEIQAGDLTLVVTPERLVCTNNELNSPFDIVLGITNSTGSTVTGLQAQITLPPELELSVGESDTRVVNQGSLIPNETGNVSWSVVIPDGLCNIDLTISFEVTSTTVSTEPFDVVISLPQCEAAPSFTLDATPSVQVISPGGQADFTVRINTDGNYTDTATLSLDNPNPSFITGVFNPSQITSSTTSTLTLTSLATSTEGNYLFTISGTDSSPETASDQVSLQIIAEPDIWPSPFTPNGDGINDGVHFVMQGMAVTSPELKIFNFNGKEVLTTQEYNGTEFYWDGHGDDGEIPPPGIYIYLIQDSSGEIASGSVVLAR